MMIRRRFHREPDQSRIALDLETGLGLTPDRCTSPLPCENNIVKNGTAREGKTEQEEQNQPAICYFWHFAEASS